MITNYKEYSTRVEDACREIYDKIQWSKMRYSEYKKKIADKYQDNPKKGLYFAQERSIERLQLKSKIIAKLDVDIDSIAKVYKVRSEFLKKIMFGDRDKWLIEDYE